MACNSLECRRCAGRGLPVIAAQGDVGGSYGSPPIEGGGQVDGGWNR
jgi:hypothetical protein